LFPLDTNVLSDAIAIRPNAGVRRWLADNDASELFLSAITIGELHKGVAMARNRNLARAAPLARWVAAVELQFGKRILPVDRAIARQWGLLMAGNHSAKAEDGLIAATALVRGFAVVTRNVQDFATTGVAVINPFD
jgi:toxin FitB